MFGKKKSSAPSISYPTLPESMISPIYENLPSYYGSTYRVPADIYSQTLPLINQSLQYRAPTRLNLPTATTPQAAQNIYEGIIGGTLSASLPGVSGIGKQATDILSQRLAAGGGIDPTILARSREQLALDIGKARTRGQQAVAEDLQRRGLFGAGSEAYRGMGEIEQELADKENAALLGLEQWQTGAQEESRQYDISQALGQSEYERTLQAEIERQNMANKLGVAGIMRGEEGAVQQVNQQRQLAEDQYMREAETAEQKRLSDTALSLYEYFNNMEQKDQAESAAIMLDVLGMYMGTGSQNARTQLDAWVNSEQFRRQDDQTFMNSLLQLGRAIGTGTTAPATTGGYVDYGESRYMGNYGEGMGEIQPVRGVY